MSFTVNNLSFAYDAAFGLQNITLAIKPQRMTAIMGLNGSGKSTLIGLLSGFIKPHSGEIHLHNQPLAKHSPLQLAQHISVVPQDFPTLFPYSVEEFVLMGTYPWKTTFFDSALEIQKVKGILLELELDTLSQRKINTLSGGERQRALLARALAQHTPILLLDEPLNHLDIKHQLIFLKRLKNLCVQQNKTIIAVMHNLKDVQKHFDQLILLKLGHLLFSGETAAGLQPHIVENVFETSFADLNLA